MALQYLGAPAVRRWGKWGLLWGAYLLHSFDLGLQLRLLIKFGFDLLLQYAVRRLRPCQLLLHLHHLLLNLIDGHLEIRLQRPFLLLSTSCERADSAFA